MLFQAEFTHLCLFVSKILQAGLRSFVTKEKQTNTVSLFNPLKLRHNAEAVCES